MRGFAKLAINETVEQAADKSAPLGDLAAHLQTIITQFAMDKIYACHATVSSVSRLDLPTENNAMRERIANNAAS